MLKIINDLTPFFEDCYRRISVREYARSAKISPPTASKLLEFYRLEGLLMKETYRNYILFYANKNNKYFIDLSRMYWKHRLNDLMEILQNKLSNPTVILFGSLSKAEAKQDSDVDIAIFGHRKDLNTDEYEKKLRRKIQIFWFSSVNSIKDKDLTNNIFNGYVLEGRLSL